MRLIFITFFIFIIIPDSDAQPLNKKMLDEHLVNIDTAFKKTENCFYIINGIAFKGTAAREIDSVLHMQDLKYLVDLEFLKCDGSAIVHCSSNAIIVSFAYKQSTTEKELLLKRLKEKFTDRYNFFSHHIFSDAKDPVLYIDNKLIHHTKIRSDIEMLTADKIFFISINERPVSPEHYGQNAKNGLVRIWTGNRQ